MFIVFVFDCWYPPTRSTKMTTSTPVSTINIKGTRSRNKLTHNMKRELPPTRYQ